VYLFAQTSVNRSHVVAVVASEAGYFVDVTSGDTATPS
jgi:hypothetical protein